AALLTKDRPHMTKRKQGDRSEDLSNKKQKIHRTDDTFSPISSLPEESRMNLFRYLGLSDLISCTGTSRCFRREAIRTIWIFHIAELYRRYRDLFYAIPTEDITYWHEAIRYVLLL